MTNRISKSNLEKRFNLPFELEYQCNEGYLLSKVGDKVKLSVKINHSDDGKTHTYVFIFRKDQRQELFRAMENLNKNPKSEFSIQTLCYSAAAVNTNLNYAHYDPRDNVEQV
ncbi:Uncharacterised protein [uncultured archaeon]|nr:Uncharacterised protein [uncultured archaeon]